MKTLFLILAATSCFAQTSEIRPLNFGVDFHKTGTLLLFVPTPEPDITNIVIPTNYTGTITVGTNVFKASDLAIQRLVITNRWCDHNWVSWFDRQSDMRVRRCGECGRTQTYIGEWK